jgi:small subunit ribosomal protein S16
MLAIKLSQKGKTNKRMFRLIISEKSRDPYGNVLEVLGSYNPHTKDLVVKGERVNYWISKGAQMTSSVNNLLIEKKIVEGAKVKASKKGEKSAKKQAQITAKADKKKKSAQEASAPVAEVKEDVVEAPVEDAEASVEASEAPVETTEEVK